MITESSAPLAVIRAGTTFYLCTSPSSGERNDKNRLISEGEQQENKPGETEVVPYVMGVFREGLRAGHHGCRPLLQLSQFLPSLVQRHPGTGEVAHHPGRRALHALHAARARDVLGQAARGLTGRRFTD